MNEIQTSVIKRICAECGKNRHRMMDIVIAVQKEFGCVPGDAMDLVADEVRSWRYMPLEQLNRSTCSVPSETIFRLPLLTATWD